MVMVYHWKVAQLFLHHKGHHFKYKHQPKKQECGNGRKDHVWLNLMDYATIIAFKNYVTGGTVSINEKSSILD